MQVTELTCGAFVLGVTWSHAIADGVGIAQFLGAVGELARGLSSPSIVPVRCDEAVSSLPPPVDPVQHFIMKGRAALDNSFTKMGEFFVLLHVTIPSSFINSVKSEFDGQPCCTTFEVAAAVLWQCRARATMSSPDALSFLAIAVNVRKHVGAKDGYYGNCVIDKLVMVTSSKVASMDVMGLVKMIKHAKDQVADDLLNGKKNASSRNNQLPDLDGRYNLLLMSYWTNIGFEEADFGSGKPARVMWHIPEIPPLPICVLCPNKVEDGISVISICVKEEHTDAFIGEIAKFV